MLTKRDLLRSAAAIAAGAAIAKPSLLMAQSYPGIIEAKDIAEAGLHLRPADRDELRRHVRVRRRPQFGAVQGAVQQIKNEPNVFTYKDTAIVTPNSDTPYSFVWMDLRAEPIVLSVPAVDPKRYYSVMLCDGNTYNYGYIGSRATGSEAGDYMVVGPDWKGETPAGHQEGVPVEHAVFARGLSHPAFRSGRHRQRQEGAGRLQGADRFRPI